MRACPGARVAGSARARACAWCRLCRAMWADVRRGFGLPFEALLSGDPMGCSWRGQLPCVRCVRLRPVRAVCLSSVGRSRVCACGASPRAPAPVPAWLKHRPRFARRSENGFVARARLRAPARRHRVGSIRTPPPGRSPVPPRRCSPTVRSSRGGRRREGRCAAVLGGPSSPLPPRRPLISASVPPFLSLPFSPSPRGDGGPTRPSLDLPGLRTPTRGSDPEGIPPKVDVAVSGERCAVGSRGFMGSRGNAGRHAQRARCFRHGSPGAALWLASISVMSKV